MSYTEIHLHTHDSNINMVEVVTKVEQYIQRAKELGLNGLIVTNHGVLTNWYNNKMKIEKAGMKYVHALESYVTWTLDQKVRDNFHLSLYAKNYDGFKELNKMVSKSFNREDGHYYYNPRITWEEIKATSDNILISTACLGGLMWKLDTERQMEVIDFLVDNKHRVFLEVQPHNHPEQKELNMRLAKLSKETGIPLITGGDIHALNHEHDKTRKVLQKSKNVCFEDEDSFDLTMKSYEERVDMFKLQGALSEDEILDAMNNTNVLLDMVEPFELDYSKKYPKVVEGDSLEVFKEKIKEGLSYRNILAKPLEERKVYAQRIQYELETYIANGAIDYMLLEDLVKSYARKMGVAYGYGRGSASGSIIAFLMQITEMNSIERGLNFERFMSKERISLADIDSDYSPSQRHIVQDFVINGIPNVYSAPIMTANTMALKGAIRDIGRGLDMSLDEVDLIAKTVEENEAMLRQQYPVLFKHVDICQGVITSVGQHACGLVCSPIPLDENMGLMTTNDSPYPITMINMKEIDAQNFVKLDILGLDTVQIISDTCKFAGIDYLTPNNTDMNDEAVWQSIREDNVNIFQWESDFAKQILQDLFSKETIAKIKKQNPNFSYMDLFSLGNAILRPSGASYRDDVIMGNFYDNGHEELNDFLAPTLGRLVYQEQLIEFLVRFCSYSAGHADILRRAIGKKQKETMEIELPKIKEAFVKTMVESYNTDYDKAMEIAEPFIQVFINSASYGFSVNHSDAYSWLGYVCGYLRYYYPLEFLTACLNANKGKKEKINELLKYAKSKGIEIKPIAYGFSKAEYMFEKESNAIYQGIESIKYLNEAVGNGLYDFKQKHGKHESFTDFLVNLYDSSSYEADEYEGVVMCSTCKKDIKQMEEDIRAQMERDGIEHYYWEIEPCPKCKPFTVEKAKRIDALNLFNDADKLQLLLTHEKHKNLIKQTDDGFAINARQMKILIILDFFKEFGENKILLDIFENFDKRYSAKHKLKTKAERYLECKEFEVATMRREEHRTLSLGEQSNAEMEYLGHVVSVRKDLDKNYYFVTEMKKNKQNVRFLAYQYASGNTFEFKISNRNYSNLSFEKGDIIQILNVSIKPKTIKVGDKWLPSPTEKTFWVNQMKCVKKKR